VYADLDGTLMGPGGSLFAHPDGPTPDPAAAVGELHLAGVDLVLVSGRTRIQVSELARAFGAAGYIAEIGGLIVQRRGRDEVLTRHPGAFGGLGRATPFEAIQRSGVVGVLLEEYRGRLEPHAPWAFLERECSMLLRGSIDLGEGRALLGRAGYGWLDLLDNGIIPAWPGRFPGLEAVPEVHAYHLVPAGVNKRSAVALDRGSRGLHAEQCVAIGDSPSDAEIAPEVGAVFIVANGEPAFRSSSVQANVYLLEASHGLGFAEAVRAFAIASGS
jgi:phosphoglycolate phosphatase